MLYEWPWKKFEALYEAHSKREQVEKATAERNAYITGLIANTNLDDNKGSKRQMLTTIDSNYQETLKRIYNIDIEDEISLKTDPFFAAMKIPGMEPESPPDSDRTTENLE